jgi:3-oxoadipate enol-lactonase
VFLHGLGGRRSNWDRQLESLAEVRRCCAWDLPGYGDSPGRPGSLPEIAQVAAEWVAGLDGRPVDVVGLSFGGMVAQHLALEHPHLVRTLALLDTSPAFGLDGVTTPEAWLAGRIRAIRNPDAAATGVEQVVDGLVGARASAEVRSELVASMRAVPPETLEAACRALVDHDTRSRLSAIAVPTLVMVGAEDTETPPSYAEAIAERIPGAELVVVPGAGHLLNLEQPEVVGDRLRHLWAMAEGVG